MPKKYQIKNPIWLVKDAKSTKFHIAADDYFGTIATIISLMKQKITKNPMECPPDFKNHLKSLEKDLIWLQKNYQIKPRIKKKNTIPKGKENSQ
jgi:hypothetical protein